MNVVAPRCSHLMNGVLWMNIDVLLLFSNSRISTKACGFICLATLVVVVVDVVVVVVSIFY
jgi:hypothetical protein